MIFWKHIQVTCYHFWRSLGLFAPCANLVTFQNSYFNEHRADCKITDEHPMNFGDRLLRENQVNFQNLVKTWWNFQTWWKPGECSKTWWKPGEFSKLGENLVNFQNLVKTWWIFKTWWKPGDFFVVNTKKCFTGSKFTKRSVLSLLFGKNYVFSWWKWIENIIGPKPGENLVNFQNLVKTWWIFKTRWKLGENLVKTWWKLGENLVKTWWKLGESLVKTRWKLENLVKTWWKLGENLVKTRWKLGENLVNFENLVKTWWKPGENSVKTWWKPGEFSKPGENLVKTWWKPGQNLVKTWSKKRPKSVWKLSAAWWKLFEKASWKPGENLMKTLWIFTTWWQPDEMSQPW